MIAERIAWRCTQFKPPSSNHAEFVICDHTIDITYIRLRHGFVYLAIILDVFTRSIRGWSLGQQLDGRLAMTALERALARGTPEIHHSDQGVQYAATGYVDRLNGAGIAVSMAAKGTPTDNPYVERVMRTIKEEEVSLNAYEDIGQARADLGHFIDVVYQTKRIHSALGYLTPREFEAQWYADQLEALVAVAT